MSKKKLSNVEVNVLSNVIREKVNEIKYEKIKSKLVKDVDFKKLEKLNKEIKLLDKKRNELFKLSNEVNLKVRNKFDISNVYIDLNDNIKVNFSNNNMNYYNEIVLMNINNSFNVDELVNKIVEKYS
jgi:hypothetical protein